MEAPRRTFVLWLAALFLAIVAAYSNHFHNSFHFDDWHTVQYNPAIRSLANLPRFFADSSTFSIVPAGQTYRPVVTASLAIDYALGGGLKPFWFHLSTFIWFLVQLGFLYALCAHLFDRVHPDPRNAWFAWLATAIYGLHPVCAETVNYIVQRGDLYSTLGIVAGVALYARAPNLRRYGVYLLPPVAGMLAKPPGLVFAPILLAYIILIDRSTSTVPARPPVRDRASRKGAQKTARGSAAPAIESLASCVRRSLPAFAVTAALAYLQRLMTPSFFTGNVGSSFEYWITQPYVALRYFRSFFLPIYLSADTDLHAFHTIWAWQPIVGGLFLAMFIAVAVSTARVQEWRPVSFGMWWFLLGLVPTSIYPLAEVENDHRMFLPFVGLAIAVTWSAAVALLRRPRPVQLTAAGFSVLLLAAFAWGTYARNAVWRTDETLWRDVTEKSPANARGLMGYGYALLARAEVNRAYDYFQRAAAAGPTYARVMVNLGTAAGALCRDAEAEADFRRAIELAPRDAWNHIGYGNWLLPRGRTDTALKAYQAAAALNPANLESSYGLMEIYSQRSDWDNLKAVAGNVLRLSPDDALAQSYAALPQNLAASAAGEERASAQRFLDLALAYRFLRRYDDSIRAANKALELRPDSAEAYLHIATAHELTGKWDKAIAASREAIRLKPLSASGLSHLVWSISRKTCQTPTPQSYSAASLH